MYKKFFMGIAAMAALTLVSCSSDDLNSLSDNSSKNEAISFDGYLGRSAVAVNGTRGSVLEIADLKASTEGFGVFGNYSSTDGTTPTYGDNLFKNEQVTYSSSNTTSTKWAYKNTKYWSTEGHIDFLAYAPYDANTALNTTLKENKTSCINFTVENTVTKQKDLLWANANGQKKANKTVTFTFNHALAKIGYKVKLNNTYSNATITLKKITLAGSADGNTPAFYKTGTIDLSKTSSEGLWTVQSSNDKQKFDWFSNNTQILSTTGYTNPTTDCLFVIPQDFSKTEEGADKLYVIVDYTIKYNNGETAEMKSTVSSQIKNNFLQGKAYTINLTIGLTPIEFNADVTAWENGATIPEIPMD